MMAGSGPGYPLLATGALLWAGFTIAMRRSGLPALQAVAVVSVASLVLYLPVYALLLEPRVLQASLSELLVQATYQGILAGFLAVYCYGRAVALLGAARGAAFLALVPVLATVMAVPLLGERPGPAELIGVALVSLGVCLASGVRLIRPLALLARSPRHAATVGLGAARLT